MQEQQELVSAEAQAVEPPKKRRGRPRKQKVEEAATAVVVHEEAEKLERIDAPMTSARLVNMAASGTADIDKLSGLADLQIRLDREANSRAFTRAVVEFQGKMPAVQRLDRANDRPYATLQRIWKEAQPILSECGLGVIWTVFTFGDSVCHLEGVLTHRDGHSIPLMRDVPTPPEIRGQNVTQRSGSAETYAKRYALCAALGIVTSTDTDGGDSREPEGVVTAEQVAAIRNVLQAKGRSEQALCEWAAVKTLGELPVSKYNEALRLLGAKVS